MAKVRSVNSHYIAVGARATRGKPPEYNFEQIAERRACMAAHLIIAIVEICRTSATKQNLKRETGE